jgi:hypothetical protein
MGKENVAWTAWTASERGVRSGRYLVRGVDFLYVASPGSVRGVDFSVRGVEKN